MFLGYGVCFFIYYQKYPSSYNTLEKSLLCKSVIYCEGKNLTWGDSPGGRFNRIAAALVVQDHQASFYALLL